jgi:cold-inducible RNA-binding protein
MSSKKLYVGGLSYDTAEETLRQTFSQAGTVETAKVIMDRDTGRSKGFGFVEMATQEEATKAIELLNGKTLDGRSLTVNEAKPMEPRRPSSGGYGGGGGYNRDRNSGGNRY